MLGSSRPLRVALGAVAVASAESQLGLAKCTGVYRALSCTLFAGLGCVLYVALSAVRSTNFGLYRGLICTRGTSASPPCFSFITRAKYFRRSRPRHVPMRFRPTGTGHWACSLVESTRPSYREITGKSGFRHWPLRGAHGAAACGAALALLAPACSCRRARGGVALGRRSSPALGL